MTDLEAIEERVRRWLTDLENSNRIPVGSPSHLPAGFVSYYREVILRDFDIVLIELKRLRRVEEAARYYEKHSAGLGDHGINAHSKLRHALQENMHGTLTFDPANEEEPNRSLPCTCQERGHGLTMSLVRNPACQRHALQENE